MLPESAVKILCKVFEIEGAPETFESYTIDKTSFNFSLSWSPNFNNRDFYSNEIIIWDFGDGTTYIGSSATHYYKFPNLYNVYATLYDKNGNAHNVTLERTLTAKNVFPDYIYLHPLNPEGYTYNLESGKASNQIIVTRYNSWQNEKFLKENNYTINLYASGSQSDHMTLSAYYSQKYSHLKPFHGFVKLSVNADNYIQTQLVESTKTDSVSVYAVPYTTGYIDGNWNIKFNFYDYPAENSAFIGTSGSNHDIDYVYFVDQKPSINSRNSVDIIYASFDSKNFNDESIEKNNLENLFKKLDNGYLNLPWSSQIIKSVFNSASTLRITSNGISVEGGNTTVGNVSGQILYPFDIYPIKWSNTEIPFVVTFKDNEGYTAKNYPPIYNFHTGTFNNKLYDINLKLVKFVDIDPLDQFVVLSAVDLKDARFKKNMSVPQYDDSPYFAGTVKLPYEAKVVAISATIQIQDSPVEKLLPIYGFLGQVGLPKVKKYEKLNVFDYCAKSDLEFYYTQKISTLTSTSTANVHICFCPLKFLDNSKENRVFILDADNDLIYKSDVDGNIVSTMNLGDMRYLQNFVEAPIRKSFKNAYGSASPVWCCTDNRGNAYVSLGDNVSAIKIDYETDIISQVYAPPFENLELYDSGLYPEKEEYLKLINNNTFLISIQYNNDIVTIQKYPQYYGFVGGNTIVPSCIDVDENNNVYVAYTHPLSNFICKYANNGELLRTIHFQPLEVPQEFIIDSDDNIWVGIENINQSTSVNLDRDDKVYFIDGKTYEKTLIKNIEGLGLLTIDKNQNLYVLNKTNTITQINRNTKTSKDYVFGITADETAYIKDIGAIAADSSGQLWVVNNVDGRLYFADVGNLSAPLSSLSFDKLKDLNYKTIQSLQSIYLTMGDWTGFRWINKYIKTEIPEPRILTNLSTYFDILNPTPTIAKYGEEFDYLTQIKSYILQESLANSNVLLDDFVGQILGKNQNVEEVGKVIYEKISNFVSNNSDLDTCNIQKLLSLADETGTDLNRYLYSYPPSIRRALDILSICHRRLFGSANSYNRNFGLSAYKYFLNNNLGSEIQIEDGTFVAGEPIVTYELFSENYKLITNTIVPNYNYGDIVPLSSVNYRWGWELVTGTKAQSGLDIKQYYLFYKYVPNTNTVVYDNIINFDSDLTTLTPKESSFEDWSKFAGYMDKVISYGFYKGLKLI